MAAPTRVLWRLPLSARHAEVARMVQKGMMNAEITRALGITECAVKGMLYQIYENVGCSGPTARIQLAVWVTRFDYERALSGPPLRYDGQPFTKRRNQ